MHRKDNAHEKSLRLIFEDYDSNFDKLPETCGEISTHRIIIIIIKPA